MKDSGIPWIGKIPEHWEIGRLKNIGSFYGGLTGKAGDDFNVDEEKDNYALFIPFTNIFNNDKINCEQLAKVKVSSNEKQNEVSFGDILFLMSSEDSEGIGKSSVYLLQLDKPIYLNSFCKGLHVINGHANSTYINYYMSCAAGHEYTKTHANGFIRINLRQEMLSKCPLLVPPLAEQERIVKYLDDKCGEIDELIDVEQQMISDLEAYRQSVITEAVTHGLNQNVRMIESGCDWFDSRPSYWHTEKIRNLFVKRSEKNNPIKTRERLSLSIDKGIILYADKTTNLDRFKDDFTQYQLAYPNDIVLNSMNMIVGAVGKSAYFGCVSPVYYVIYSKDKNVNMDFYGYLLNIPIIRDVYHKLGQGIYAIERGDGRVNTCRLKVDYYEFSQIKVPVPPIEEQNAIVSFLKEKEYEIDELIKVKQEKIETLKQYRQSLIFEAVTGKTTIA